MFRHSFFWVLFAALAILAALHVAGLSLGWYSVISWLDAMTHFLGGFWVGGMALWFYFLSGAIAEPRVLSAQKLFGFTIIFILVIGGLWEFFELAIGATGFREHDFVTDTATDLAMDTFGAVAAGVYFVTHHNANNTNERCE